MQMKIIMLFAVTALCLNFMGCQEPEPRQLSEEDVAAIGNSAESFVQAVSDNDLDAWVAHYTEDAVLMPPNQHAVEGRAAMLEWWTASGFTIADFTITSLEIEGRDGLAYRRGAYSQVFTVQGITEAIADSGKFIEIWKKQADGSWKIGQDIWNSSVPLPGAE